MPIHGNNDCTMVELNDGKMGPTDLDIRKVNWINDRSSHYVSNMIMMTQDHRKLVYIDSPYYKHENL